MAYLADIAGIVVDMRQVPDHGDPQPGELVVRSTGTGYTDDNGVEVARTELTGHNSDNS